MPFCLRYTNNRLNEGKDLLKDGAEIEEKKRRRTVCTSSFFDDDSGAGFLQRFPEFKWFLVLVLLGFDKLVALEIKGNAPKRRKSNNNVDNSAYNAVRAAADPCNKVKAEQTYKSPVKTADEKQKKRDFVHHFHFFAFLWVICRCAAVDIMCISCCSMRFVLPDKSGHKILSENPKKISKKI